MAQQKFDYKEAFRINSGILSAPEQDKLSKTRVTIVGVGGAGGAIAIMLARSGFSHFNLIDFDTYSASNLNRQVACFNDTIGQHKAEVVKREILRINPEAAVNATNRKITLEELGSLLNDTDVYFSEADDLAYSNCSLIMAQQKQKLAICYMPCGMSGFVMVFPPAKKIYDPTDLFGGPKGLSYMEQHEFQRNPMYRKGRRFHIMQGKMRIAWFNDWCQGKTTLTQLCPSVWLGASLASIEAIKWLTGRFKTTQAPKIWQIDLGENRVRVCRFRWRTRLFSKYIYSVYNSGLPVLPTMIKNLTAKSVDKDLCRMKKEEDEGKSPRPPFMWKHVI